MNPGYYTLDADNRPVKVRDVMEWARWFEDADRRVDYTEITSACRVSTVFLGLDHRFGGEGPPLLFELMVFGGPLDGECRRFSSWDDAATAHKAMVRKLRRLRAESQTESHRQRSGG